MFPGPTSVGWWAMFITMLALILPRSKPGFRLLSSTGRSTRIFRPMTRKVRESSGHAWQAHCRWARGH